VIYIGIHIVDSSVVWNVCCHTCDTILGDCVWILWSEWLLFNTMVSRLWRYTFH